MDLSDLLTMSIEQKASDLHITPHLSPMLRINGELVPIDGQKLESETIKNWIYSLLNFEEQKKFEQDWEIDFAIALPNQLRFRVNAFYQASGIAAVFRVIPKDIPTLDQLNMPPVFKELLSLHNGLVLMTGPTGSGKSTTLAAMVDYINTTRACHIITIEDPIEFTHQSKKSLINQRQIGKDAHHFAGALRSALREDPDVILVGEMRDLETIRLALTAAETGHLVLATLHTSSAPRAISRIIDVFPAGEKNVIRNMLSESIQAIIAQVLIKGIAGGRVAAFEIMLGTSAIRNLIREDKIAQMYTSLQTGSSVGMCTLEQSIEALVSKKMITPIAAKDRGVKRTIIMEE